MSSTSTASSSIGPYHPSQPEEIIPPLPDHIDDPASERPSPDEALPPTSPLYVDGELTFPPIVLGCAVFGYGIYSAKADVLGDLPVRTVRYALRSGINAFDTSPWYHPSELILGRVFEAIKAEFPRKSYSIITKVGKYGPKASQHSYAGPVVRASVERSLRRLKTDYLDVVYLHDIEFVSSPPSCPAGDHLPALTDPADRFSLRPPHVPLGPGDEQILEGLTELRALQREGKIRAIGIAGFPLPVLLRIALLAAATPAVGPVELVQTYAHQSLINDNLSRGYLAAFEKAGVKQVLNAAPLSMGILTSAGGPSWHPVNEEKGAAYEACREAAALCRERGTTIEDVAVGFGFRELEQENGQKVPVVIGCKNIEEIRRTLKGWKKVNGGGNAEENERLKAVEEEVGRLFEARGVKGWSWESPGKSAL